MGRGAGVFLRCVKLSMGPIISEKWATSIFVVKEEAGSSTFLRNLCILLKNYTLPLHIRKQASRPLPHAPYRFLFRLYVTYVILQSSAAIWIKSPAYWAVMKLWKVVGCGRFGISCWSYLHSWNDQRRIPGDRKVSGCKATGVGGDRFWAKRTEANSTADMLCLINY